MKKNLLLLPFVMSATFYTGCIQETSPKVVQRNNNSVPTAPPPINPPQERKLPLANFSYHKLQTVQGPILTVGESHTGFLFPKFKGKIILLQVFGQDCPHCFKEIPIINSLQEKYRQNLQIVALQVQEPMSKGKANSLIQQFNMNYPIIDKDKAVNLMYGLKNNYEWNGILPFILLIKNGVTQEVFRGEKSQKRIERAIQELL